MMNTGSVMSGNSCFSRSSARTISATAKWAARLQALSWDLLLAVRGLTVDELHGSLG
jgi:hypothetical protein